MKVKLMFLVKVLDTVKPYGTKMNYGKKVFTIKFNTLKFAARFIKRRFSYFKINIIVNYIISKLTVRKKCKITNFFKVPELLRINMAS